jgi:cell division protein YceG involved in septum cleavage
MELIEKVAEIVCEAHDISWFKSGTLTKDAYRDAAQQIHQAYLDEAKEGVLSPELLNEISLKADSLDGITILLGQSNTYSAAYMAAQAQRLNDLLEKEKAVKAEREQVASEIFEELDKHTDPTCCMLLTKEYQQLKAKYLGNGQD